MFRLLSEKYNRERKKKHTCYTNVLFHAYQLHVLLYVMYPIMHLWVIKCSHGK